MGREWWREVEEEEKKVGGKEGERGEKEAGSRKSSRGEIGDKNWEED